jgi:hypothetical protein
MSTRHATFAFAALMAAAGAAAQDLAKSFPPTTLAYAEFAGLRACKAAGERTGVVQLGKHVLERGGHDVVQQHAGQQLDAHVGQLSRSLAQFGFDVGRVRAVMQGGWAVGVARPVFFDGTVWPSILVAFDTEDRNDVADAFLADAVNAISRDGKRLTVTVSQRGDAKLSTLQHPSRSGTVVIGRSGRFAFATNSPRYLDECLAARAGQSPSLADDPLLAERRTKDGIGLLSVIARVEPLLGGSELLMPYEVLDIAAAFGVGRPRSLSLTADVDDAGSRDALRLSMPLSPDGFLRSFAGAPLSGDVLRYCGKDTLAVAGVNLDPKAIGELVTRLAAALPADAARRFRHMLDHDFAHALHGAGMSPDDLAKLSAALGSEAVVVTTLPAVYPDFTMFVRIRDRATVERYVEQAAAMATSRGGIEWREHDVDGTRIRSTSVRTPVIPLAPAYAFHDDWLIVSTQMRVLRAALLQSKNGDVWRQQRDAWAARIANGGAVQLHADTDVAIDKLWSAARVALSALQSSFAPDLAPDAIPDVDEMKQFVSGLSLDVKVDADGIAFSQRQPLGLGSMLAAFGTLLDAGLEMASDQAKTTRQAPASGGAEQPKRRIF